MNGSLIHRCFFIYFAVRNWGDPWKRFVFKPRHHRSLQ